MGIGSRAIGASIPIPIPFRTSGATQRYWDWVSGYQSLHPYPYPYPDFGSDSEVLGLGLGLSKPPSLSLSLPLSLLRVATQRDWDGDWVSGYQSLHPYPYPYFE